jgi:hypothetical protein
VINKCGYVVTLFEYRLMKRECALDERESGLEIPEYGLMERNGWLVIVSPGDWAPVSTSSAG